MKKPTINHMDIRVDFTEDVEYLRSPVLIYTRTFNDLLDLKRSEYACFIVPDTEYTDGASWNPLVTLLLWMEKRDKKVRLAALGHDYLYRMAGLPITFYKFDKETRTRGKKITDMEIGRIPADKFIKDKADALGSNIYRMYMIYWGLLIGGSFAFNRYKKNNIK